MVWMALVASLVLLLTQYLNFVALYATLAIDYLVVGRRQVRLSWRQWALLLLPQLVVGAILAVYWNPIGRGTFNVVDRGHFLDKLALVTWHFRDLNAAEYGTGILLLASPLLCAFVPSVWLWRGPLAIAVYVIVTALASPQPPLLTRDADIRYLCPIIPLCIFSTAWFLLLLCRGLVPPHAKQPLKSIIQLLAVPLAVFVFGTNLANLPGGSEYWRSSIVALAREYLEGRTTAIRETADWINRHVEPGVSVFVAPYPITHPRLVHLRPRFPVDDNAYSLMLHAPHAVYGWQLTEPVPPGLASQPPIQFNGRIPPDLIIAFGSGPNQVASHVVNAYAAAGVRYQPIAPLDVYSKEGTRPELFLHLFRVWPFDPRQDGVFIYQLTNERPGS
jgi:hypothetical protein